VLDLDDIRAEVGQQHPEHPAGDQLPAVEHTSRIQRPVHDAIGSKRHAWLSDDLGPSKP
jgi:hypothetical protein